MKFLLIIYLLTILLCLCSYALYPLIIWVVGKMFPFRIRRTGITPQISIVISAYNEAEHIGYKIENTLKQSYPKEKTEILVGSDGSSDETVTIARRYEGQNVRVYDFDENRGKTAVQNELVSFSKGEIVIFTDAASLLQPDAIEKMIRNFSDHRVGCVAGSMHFADIDTNITTQSQGLYWRYELMLRYLESGIGSLIGVDGPLYAVRRDSYVPLGPHIISDLITPMLVLGKGKKVILENRAFVEEDPTTKTKQEFSTRRRITLRGLIGISAHRRLLNPIKYPFIAFQLFFHKILRWYVGPLMVLNFLSCCVLSGNLFFRYNLIGYGILLLAAAMGWGADRLGIKIKSLAIPYYFTVVNSGATMGIIDFFRGRQASTWETVRS